MNILRMVQVKDDRKVIKIKILFWGTIAFAGLTFGLFLSSLSVSAAAYQKSYRNESSAKNVSGKTINVPFKGVIHGNDTDIGETDTTVTVSTTGTGKGTLLGRFTFVQVVTVNTTDGSDTGVAHWVASDGDSIEISIAGSGVPTITPDGLVFDITETDTIIGGTGRFQGVQGSFTMVRVASPDTFLTSGSFDGNLNSLVAAR